MNKKLLTMVTTGAIALSNMNFAFADIPKSGVPKGEKPTFEKIPNAHIPEIEMLMEEFDDEAVEMGDDIVDDVISGEEYEEEESEADDSMDEEPSEDEEEDDDEIMDEIEKDAEKYDKENEEDTIGGIDDDYYDVGEEPEIKDEDPAENIPDEDDKAESNKEKEEVKESNKKEVVSNENNSNTNVGNNTAGAISQDKEVEHQVVTNADDTKVDEDKVVKELDEPQSKGNSSGNPKTGDVGIIGSIAGMIVGLGGIILRKRL